MNARWRGRVEEVAGHRLLRDERFRFAAEIHVAGARGVQESGSFAGRALQRLVAQPLDLPPAVSVHGCDSTPERVDEERDYTTSGACTVLTLRK